MQINSFTHSLTHLLTYLLGCNDELMSMLSSDKCTNNVNILSSWTSSLISLVQFSSVQFSYSIYVSRSLIIKIMTAALTSSNYVKHFSFQPARELSECQWCRNFWRQTVRSTLTDQRLKSFVDRSQLFLSVAQPGHRPWPAERKWRLPKLDWSSTRGMGRRAGEDTYRLVVTCPYHIGLHGIHESFLTLNIMNINTFSCDVMSVRLNTHRTLFTMKYGTEVSKCLKNTTRWWWFKVRLKTVSLI